METTTLGQLLALLSATSFAAANNFISRTTRSGGDKGVVFSVLVTLVLSFFLWLVLGAKIGDLHRAGAAFWVGLGWYAAAGIAVMLFGRMLLYQSIHRIGVSRAAAVKRLNPFFSVILAALLLGEAVTVPDLAGMMCIALAFGLLVHASLTRKDAGEAPLAPQYLFGVFAAMAYALAYVTRKLGLEQLPDPALGTFVSALTGLLAFTVVALFSPRQRANLTGVFRHLDRWIVLSALMVSSGQILLFAALAYEKVSNVAMIASLEIFVSMFLATMIFRTEGRPSMSTLISAALATAGVVLVAAG